MLFLTPFPTLPPRGKEPSRQAGSFAKIAHWAIFKRSALPLGEIRKGVLTALLFSYSFTTAPTFRKSSKNPGYDLATQCESFMKTVPVAPRAATAEAIAIRWSS